MASILIADPSNSNRLYLKLLLEMHGYDVLQAQNGHEAIRLFDDHAPHLTITEIALPDLSGAELVQHIKACSDEQFYPVFVITAVVGAQRLQGILQAGADDFLQKPFVEELFLAKVDSLLRNLDFYNDLKQSKEMLAQVHSNLAWEHQSAQRIFDKFVYGPRQLVPGLDVHISAASIFNGDVFFSSVTPSGHVITLLGDFTGHGLPAAIGAIPVAETFYSMVSAGRNIKEILLEINRKLKKILPDHIFFGCLVVEVSPKKRKAHVFNGGMQPILVFDGITPNVRRLMSNSLPLGVVENEHWHPELKSFMLEGHEQFVFYTDGVVEAVNAQGDMFGLERLVQALQGHRLHIPSLVEAAEDFCGDGEFDDDVSIVKLDIARVIEKTDMITARVLAEQLRDPSSWELSFYFGTHQLRQADKPVETVVDAISGTQPLVPFKDDLFMVITELYMNALEHGLLCLDSALKQDAQGFLHYAELKQRRLAQLNQGGIGIQIKQSPVSADQADIHITVTHDGEGVCDHVMAQPDGEVHRYAGRGIKLVRSLCHQFEFDEQGRKVTAIYRWERPHAKTH
ncbi:PP2C family protein-serine/threonine phosphatase [Thiomicrospira sp. WB1]|uniref:PP2C family protein-serine/threonine phosphatase n=1 Tax=Thiomicrospira sp. WB1 TaxID=1685380 RepID=UPI00074A7F47|nr:fused response regulator/phosphatase [Thiomicrospira sp. WB1]KUJ72177.1 response regulator receiver protein [Thiomicrospira sp. WB1]